MADNYLERREEEVRQGHGISYRSSVPNLEQLLLRCFAGGAFDPSYKVHDMQLDAIISIARLLPIKNLTFSTLRLNGRNCNKALSEYCEDAAGIIIRGCPNGNGEALVELGETVLAFRLKAAEMGLSTELLHVNYGPSEPIRSVVAVGKKR